MTKKLFFKKPYLSQVLSGEKDLEGRVGYDNIRKINVNDTILIQGTDPFYVRNLNMYASFQEAVKENNYKRLIPDAKSVMEAIKIYEDIYPVWKQKKLGVYIFEIKRFRN